MEIIAGENACYRLLAFISFKMKLSSRINRVGKVHPNFPSEGKIPNLKVA
jgi:hypothetical protein